MKKILSIILAAVMCITVCTPFSACADDGRITARITDDGITWLKVSENGNEFYCGLENTDDAFPYGSDFWVSLINREDDAGEWYKYYRELDDTHKKIIVENELSIIKYGVTYPDGNECHAFYPSVHLYVQLGEKLSEEEISALFANNGEGTLSAVVLTNYTFPDGTFGEVLRIELSSFDTGVYSTVGARKPTAGKSVNTLQAKGKTVKIKRSALKKKSVIIKRKKAITVKGAKGKLSYKKIKGNAKIKVNKKTGKIKVKKGLKKGTYTVKIKVKAAGNGKYKSAAKTVKVKIVVK